MTGYVLSLDAAFQVSEPEVKAMAGVGGPRKLATLGALSSPVFDIFDGRGAGRKQTMCWQQKVQEGYVDIRKRYMCSII